MKAQNLTNGIDQARSSELIDPNTPSRGMEINEAAGPSKSKNTTGERSTAGGGIADAAQTDRGSSVDSQDKPGSRNYSRVVPPQNSILLCMAQVCEYLGGMSERKIYELISAGKFPKPIKFDRVARWRRSDLDRWAENLLN